MARTKRVWQAGGRAAEETREWRWRLGSLAVIWAFFALLGTLVELRWDHHLSAFVILTLAWIGPRTRRVALLALPFALVGIGYELVPYFIRFRGTVHVDDLWHLERYVFPGPGGASLSDWLSSWSFPVLDLATGLAYITYLLEIVGLIVWFHFRGDTSRSLRLSVGFFTLNALGWATWVVWPAAPPWYVDQYGLGPANLEALPSAAGAARFDELLGIELFSDFYSRNTNVFGAMPSLHAGYAIQAALVSWDFGRGMRRFTVIYAALICFGAVYLRHHYLLDVVAGGIIAWLVDALVQRVQRSVSARSSSLVAPTAEEPAA